MAFSRHLSLALSDVTSTGLKNTIPIYLAINMDGKIHYRLYTCTMQKGLPSTMDEIHRLFGKLGLSQTCICSI
jgi:hypothetical protein